MLIKKFLSIIHKADKNYIVRLVIFTALLLLIVVAMLESKNSEISFVYNNF